MAKTAKGGGEAVRFNVYLPREAYENLQKLQELSGKRSLAETVRAAVQLYLTLQQEMDQRKQIVLEGKGREKERLRLVNF